MRPAIRYDRQAVSPVIATILLVAITVVLAAVLYVMVSGLLTPAGNGPQIMGVVLSKTGDGKNWSLEIASTPLGLSRQPCTSNSSLQGARRRCTKHSAR